MFQKNLISNFFYHMEMGCNVYDIQNEVVIYDIKNKKLKQFTYFGMI